jgi:branched-chain amino acid transport system ATP-binding protein
LAPSALTLTGVDTYYGDSHILQSVSFTLGEGRLLGLLGRNGAGKSTCLNTIVGLLSSRNGSIDVFGTRISGWPPERISAQGVALVPQGRRIFRSLTVRENLIVAAQRNRDAAKPAWTLERIFEMFPRLQERRSQFAGSLSGGEQQMLAIGRALMGNPRVLLMDEPSEGLAPQIVADVGRTISRLKSDGLSIVLVEQNIKLTLEIADDIVIFNSGRVAFNGPAVSITLDSDIVAEHLGVH